jgi:methionine-rich copper-binding protein CopC
VKRYPDRVRQLRFIVLLVCLVLAGTAPPAGAHAKLARSEPPGGSTLRAAPSEVRLWFTENLEAAFSAAHLLDGGRRRVDGVQAAVDPLDGALLRLAVPALAAGRYVVVYRVVSIDSHVTAGELTFTIAR